MPDGTSRRPAAPSGPRLPIGGAVLVGPSVSLDPGLVLTDPATAVVERPNLSELPVLLRDRVARLPLPPPVSGTKPGTVVGTVAVTAKELTGLLRGTTDGDRVVWSMAGNEVLVHLDGITAVLEEGAVAVVVPVETEQTKRVDLPVVFAVGAADRESGLLAATPSRPPGPAAVVDRWGEAVQALAWNALLQVAVALAAKAGTDARGEPLVPIALRATADALVVIPQARHRKFR